MIRDTIYIEYKTITIMYNNAQIYEEKDKKKKAQMKRKKRKR